MDTNGYETGPENGRSPHAATPAGKRPGGPILGALCWTGAAGLFAASCARLVTSGAEGGLAWFIDMVAMFAAQIAIVAGAFALVTLALRRRGAAALAAGACAVAFSGVPLAARAPFAGPAGVPANGPGGSVVRVLVANTYVLNERSVNVAEFLDAQEVDAAIVLEAHLDLMKLLLNGDRPIRKRLPYAWVPTENWPGFWYLFTRWPQSEELGKRPANVGYNNQPQMVVCSTVERPAELGGPFLMIACHLFSPHTPKSRDEGNQKLRHIIAEVASKGDRAGLPVIVGGDFNSSPTGWRSRELTRDAADGGGGLLRAKPWSTMQGTRPGGAWPVSMAIDDVFVSPGVKVVSWKTVEIPGSDHAGVIAEVWVPGANKK